MPTTALQTLVLAALFGPPPCQVEDVDRFPCYAAVVAAHDFHEARKKYLENRLALDPRHADYWRALIRENDRRYEPWEWLAGACYHSDRLGDYPVSERIVPAPETAVLCLRALRAAIGEEDYAAGRVREVWR